MCTSGQAQRGSILGQSKHVTVSKLLLIIGMIALVTHHPKFFVKIVSSNKLHVQSSQNKSFCDSCRCNESHKLPFGVSSLKSLCPLDLLYTDVWGPSPIRSIDGYSYYVIFVDHYTKYS